MHALGIISKLLISPPRHGRYWAVKPIALPGDNSPKKIPARETLPWVPEVFRRSCLPKTCRPAADEAPVTRENKPLVPRVGKLVFKKILATGNR